MSGTPTLLFVDGAARETRWKRGRWWWAVWAVLPPLACLPLAMLSGDWAAVHEGGLAESLQAGLLLVTALSSIFVAARLDDFSCRNATLLLGVLATLALSRELDLHVLMNPEHLGRWGVRYRLDWWTSGSVGAAVKAVWILIFACVSGLLVILVRRSAGPIHWRFARPRLMVLAVCMYAVGFACDDLLRGVINLHIAQWVEETSELLAAASLLGATLGPESAVARAQPGATRGSA